MTDPVMQKEVDDLRLRVKNLEAWVGSLAIDVPLGRDEKADIIRMQRERIIEIEAKLDRLMTKNCIESQRDENGDLGYVVGLQVRAKNGNEAIEKVLNDLESRRVPDREFVWVHKEF